MKNLVWLLCFVLAGCGYHLKQKVTLDAAYDSTYLNHALSANLYQPLAIALSNQGVNLVKDAKQATAKINIISDRLTKQVQSIGVNNRVQEYRLDYELVFSVEFLDRMVITDKRLHLSRDFAFDIGQITGAQAEEQVLREQMTKDMAQMIIRTIANRQ